MNYEIFMFRKKIKYLLLSLFISISGNLFSQDNIEILIPGGHTREIIDIAFSPDNKLLASFSVDNMLIIWDIETGMQITSQYVEHSGQIYFLDNERIVIKKELLYSYFVLYNSRLNEQSVVINLYNLLPKPIKSYKYRNSNDSVFIKRYKIVKFEKLRNGFVRRKFIRTSRFHDNYFTTLNVSEKYNIIVAANEDNCLYVYNAKWSFKKKHLRKHKGQVNRIIFSRNQEYFATAGKDRSIIIWNTKSLTLYKQFKPLIFQKTVVALSEDATKIIIGDEIGNVYYIDITQDGINTNILRQHNGKVTDIEFLNSENQFISAGSDKILRIFDISKGQNIFENIERTEKIVISPNGKFIVTNGGTFIYTETKQYFDVKSFNAVKFIGETELLCSTYPHLARSYYINLQKEKLSKFDFYEGLIDIDTSYKTVDDPTGMGGGTTTEVEYTDRPWFGIANDFYILPYSNDVLFVTDWAFVKMDYINNYAYGLKHGADNFYYEIESEEIFLPVNNTVAVFENSPETWNSPVIQSVYTDDYEFKIKMLDIELIANNYLIGHTDLVTDIYPSPQNNIIATASVDGSVKLWNIDTKQLLLTIYATIEGVVLLTPDNKFVASSRIYSQVGVRINNTIINSDLKTNYQTTPLEIYKIISD